MTEYTHYVLERLTGKEIKVGPHNQKKYVSAVDYITLDKPIKSDNEPAAINPVDKVAGGTPLRPKKASRNK